MGRVTQYVYDSRGWQIAMIQPNGSVTITEYDGGGRVVATIDANGNTTSYTYDKLGRKLSVTVPDPNGGSNTATTKYHYDDANDKSYVTNALGTDYTDNNHTTETDYNQIGQVIDVIQPAPRAARPGRKRSTPTMPMEMFRPSPILAAIRPSTPTTRTIERSPKRT